MANLLYSNYILCKCLSFYIYELDKLSRIDQRLMLNLIIETSILTQTKYITNYWYVNKAKNVRRNTRLDNNLDRPVATFR
jgi:hypothetical protein